MVEDNEMLLSGISKTLEDFGHCVEGFTHGSRADQHLKHEGADLAIIDINLPGMDGLGITQRLRQREQKLPVLILTARSSTEDRVRGLDAGADDYLVKPFAMAELAARVRALGQKTRPITGRTRSPWRVGLPAKFPPPVSSEYRNNAAKTGENVV